MKLAKFALLLSVFAAAGYSDTAAIAQSNKSATPKTPAKTAKKSANTPWGQKGDWGTHDQKNDAVLPSGDPYDTSGKPNPGPKVNANDTGVSAGPVGTNPGGVSGDNVRNPDLKAVDSKSSKSAKFGKNK